jgi:hypothetical protein
LIALVGCAVAASTLSVGVAGRSAGASAKGLSLDGGSVGRLTNKHVLMDWNAPHTAAERAALASPLAAATTVKHYTRNISDGSTFPVTMVGTDPFVTEAKPSTGVTTELIPLRLNFTSFGFSQDPTVGDNCDPASIPVLTRTQNGPVFKSHSWSFGGTSVGSAQYVDAFQRAEFYQFTKPTGINPNYHVRLNATTPGGFNINVSGGGHASGLACGNGQEGALDIGGWDSFVQSTLIPAAASSFGVGSTTFPIFLVHNVVWTNGSQCCIIGYHNAFTNGAGHTQTYAVADYDDSGFFTSGVKDVAALSHEVGEWMNDPFVNNPTNAWGGIGQVSGCQSNFEVGDPLSGTFVPVKMGPAGQKFLYHPQEMAFLSWFYHEVPSIGINGKYSNNGTFGGDAKACPPGGTN